MLYSKGLHKICWDEAICCAKYILNEVLNKAVLLVTPIENRMEANP